MATQLSKDDAVVYSKKILAAHAMVYRLWQAGDDKIKGRCEITMKALASTVDALEDKFGALDYGRKATTKKGR